MHGEDDDLNARRDPADLTGRLHAVEDRHRNVHEDDVRHQLLGQLHGCGAVGRFADHGKSLTLE